MHSVLVLPFKTLSLWRAVTLIVPIPALFIFAARVLVAKLRRVLTAHELRSILVTRCASLSVISDAAFLPQ